ncbi:hypothetical protein PoB_006571700 [Plakobranchus ocellatus]|uniref:Uncharacterized protein n=1 Tax=Plakobranchus ocellatus TaxID=259542 RepID=A0AAV4D4S1_9GAST|nr:hypothetical protein PoB_006571700 [Plakobranchus ocellatus]
MEKEGTAPDGVSLMIIQLPPYVPTYPASPNFFHKVFPESFKSKTILGVTVDMESSSEIFLRASCVVPVIGRGQFSLQMSTTSESALEIQTDTEDTTEAFDNEAVLFYTDLRQNI